MTVGRRNSNYITGKRLLYSMDEFRSLDPLDGKNFKAFLLTGRSIRSISGRLFAIPEGDLKLSQRGDVMNEKRFIDFYEILQVSPNADPDTIEGIFRLLAKHYHPDNAQTGDADRFSVLVEAFRTLSNPEKRAEYDATYLNNRREQIQQIYSAPTWEEDDQSIQNGILSVLYTARRQNPAEAGIGIFELEKLFEVPQGQLDFHLWYLLEKKWVGRTDSGRYAITVNGVDAIREMDRVLRRDRLLPSGEEAR